MIDRAQALIDELLGRCRFPPPGSQLTLAVSGGADSFALLVLAVAAGCVVTAVHVDHGLRPGSATEADVVAEVAERFGAAFRSETVAVADGPNLEARARAARYGVLPVDVCTGHTTDDRAETILLHLLRGTGLDGLGALDPGDPRRPLLRLRRRETRALCDALGIATVEDPSNDDPRFVRNRVRHELLPLLDDIAGRDVAPLLARTGDVVAGEVAFLDGLAAAVDPVDVAGLRSAPRVLAVRALRHWLAAGHDGYAPSAAEMDRVMDVVEGRAVATELSGGRRVARRGMRLRVERSD